MKTQNAAVPSGARPQPADPLEPTIRGYRWNDLPLHIRGTIVREAERIVSGQPASAEAAGVRPPLDSSKLLLEYRRKVEEPPCVKPNCGACLWRNAKLAEIDAVLAAASASRLGADKEMLDGFAKRDIMIGELAEKYDALVAALRSQIETWRFDSQPGSTEADDMAQLQCADQLEQVLAALVAGGAK